MTNKKLSDYRKEARNNERVAVIGKNVIDFSTFEDYCAANSGIISPEARKRIESMIIDDVKRHDSIICLDCGVYWIDGGIDGINYSIRFDFHHSCVYDFNSGKRLYSVLSIHAFDGATRRRNYWGQEYDKHEFECGHVRRTFDDFDEILYKEAF